MEYIDGKKVLDAGDGDIIVQNKEPWVIEDKELLELIKKNRENKKTFKYKVRLSKYWRYFKRRIYFQKTFR